MLFDPAVDRLEQPGRPGYSHYDVDIVSAELPCGAAWLATALLELGVPLWRPWGIDDRGSWTQLGARRWCYRYPDSAWSRLLPGLVDGREFRLRPSPVPRFGHHWPGMLSACSRRILFVRDPRDALYSAWRRESRLGRVDSGCNFTTWVAGPYAHLPLSRAEYLRCYWQSWLHADDSADVLLLRFEDSKRHPQRSLARAAKFLGIAAPARALARACKAADHSRAAAADRALANAGIGPRMLADGIAEEWRQHFTPAMHAAVGARFDVLCARFGYAVCAAPADPCHTPGDRVDPHALAVALQPAWASDDDGKGQRFMDVLVNALR